MRSRHQLRSRPHSAPARPQPECPQTRRADGPCRSASTRPAPPVCRAAFARRPRRATRRETRTARRSVPAAAGRARRAKCGHRRSARFKPHLPGADRDHARAAEADLRLRLDPVGGEVGIGRIAEHDVGQPLATKAEVGDLVPRRHAARRQRIVGIAARDVACAATRRPRAAATGSRRPRAATPAPASGAIARVRPCPGHPRRARSRRAP